MSLLHYPLFMLPCAVLIFDIISLANPDWSAKYGIIHRKSADRTLGYKFGLIEWCEEVSGLTTTCNTYQSVNGEAYQQHNDQLSLAAFGLLIQDALWWWKVCLAMLILSVLGSLVSLALVVAYLVARRRVKLVAAAVFMLATLIFRLVALGMWGSNWSSFAPTLNLLKARAVHVTGGYFTSMFVLTAVACLLAVLAIVVMVMLICNPDLWSLKKTKRSSVQDQQEVVPSEVREIQ